MKRRPLLFTVAAAIILAAGLRFSSGQGFQSPVASGGASVSSGDRADRLLTLQLRVRGSDRVLRFDWPVVVEATPTIPTITVKCHRWTNCSFFGVPLFGFPWSRFEQSFQVDRPDSGVSGAYDYNIEWKALR